MNLHETLMKLGSGHHKMNGKGFSDLLTFDLADQTISNGKIVLMKNGKIIPQEIKVNGEVIELENDLGLNSDEEFFAGLERRFAEYYISVPTPYDNYMRMNFQCKTYEELTTKEFNLLISRSLTKYELEWWVIANTIAGRVNWPNPKHYFWHSKKYRKLYLYDTDVCIKKKGVR